MKITQTFWKKKALLIFTVVVPGVGVMAVRGQSADSFDPNANGPIRAIGVQRDGKVLIGGDFTVLSPNGGAPVTRNHIARLNSDGTIDGTFDPNADGPVGVIVLQADGGILVGSGYENYGTSFTRIGGRLRNNIARLDPRTGLADSFDPNADGGVSAITIDAGGRILVGGGFTNIGGQSRNHIARLHGNTGVADSFDPNADGAVRAITFDADGRILTGGDFSNIAGQERDHLARLNHNSGLADAFDPRTQGNGETIRTVVLLPDSTILSCGFYYRRSGMHRLDPLTGLVLPTPNVDALVTSVGLRASGEILVGGTFTVGWVYPPRHYVAEFDGTTFAIDSFDPGANGGVYAMVLQPGGDVLIGGEFTTIGGQARNYIARLKAEPNGSFVIGDLDAVVGHTVYFWGSQWSSHNHPSQGAAPSAFKGFANSISNNPPNCDGMWRNDLGNNSGPPDSVPDFITVIASSSITRSGPSSITGNNRKIVVVRTDLGYDSDLGHPGTGTVVSVTCQ